MNEVMMLRGSEPGKILQNAIAKNIPALISYLHDGNWQTARVLFVSLEKDRFYVKFSPKKKSNPIKIQLSQSAGISFKQGYGDDRFVFDTVVMGIEAVQDSNDIDTISLGIPEQIELISRRSFFRIRTPKSLAVDVELWRQGHGKFTAEPCFRGKLVDLSAGGLQFAIDSKHKTELRMGEFVGLRFTPLPHETPLMFNAQVKTVLTTADDTMACFGLQTVGLEASPEGRLILQRLCSVVDQYHQLNQTAVEQPDTENISI